MSMDVYCQREQRYTYETDMDEMIDAFYITDHIREDDLDRATKPMHELSSHLQERHTEHTSKKEAKIKRLSRLPLYVGARISVLRTCPSILNLQSDGRIQAYLNFLRKCYSYPYL